MPNCRVRLPAWPGGKPRAAAGGILKPAARERQEASPAGLPRGRRALDQDAVGVGQVLLERGRAAAAEASPQTGDGGGVSYPRLVLDLDRAHRGEQLLDQVVLFVVQGGAAEAGEPEGPPRAAAVYL